MGHASNESSKVSVHPATPADPAGSTSPRAIAPGRLAIVQALLNTADRETRRDEFGAAANVKVWLESHGLIDAETAITEDERGRVIEYREALRTIVGASGDDELPEGAIERLAVAQGAGATLVPVAQRDGRIDLVPAGSRLDAAFAEILRICHDAAVDGTWERFRLCRNPECRSAFYDASRNRSGVWCDMATCGSRHKSRAYRLRRAQ